MVGDFPIPSRPICTGRTGLVAAARCRQRRSDYSSRKLLKVRAKAIVVRSEAATESSKINDA